MGIPHALVTCWCLLGVIAMVVAVVAVPLALLWLQLVVVMQFADGVEAPKVYSAMPWVDAAMANSVRT